MAIAIARALFGRQFLHAAKLKFVHPRTGKSVTVESLLPDDLRRFLEKIRSGEARGA
ncbi:MAG: hypothetical protein U1D32_00185 [Patescibacteria group bacterium]|nr:hypothetical protein [Patescibacteria group bacterium]